MISPTDLLPPKLSLPQTDDDPEGRSRQLAGARDAYRYAYDKPNIRGLAMCAQPPDADRPEAAWFVGIAGVSRQLVANAHADAGRPGPEQIYEIQQAIEARGLAGALQVVGDVVVSGEKGRTISSFGDYVTLFHEWHPPVDASEMLLDGSFARARLSGPNPCWIRRVDPGAGVPADFGVTEAHYAASAGENDTLEAARAEGRLFLCEYRELLDLLPGSAPVPDGIDVDYAKDPAAWDTAYQAREAEYAKGRPTKALVAPLSLFAVPRGERELVPVAIQLFPDGHRGQRYPVFTPRDGLAWIAAKACVHAADGTMHEAVSHLGLTHLVQEAFYLAVRNTLSSRHPLHRLLIPHFEGTTFINAAADKALVSPAGYVDKLLLPTIGGAIQLCAKAVRGFDFNASMFPRQLESRGVDSDDVLPVYPYRDDGKLVWKAIESWVASYVNHHYRTDGDVGADAELQAMVRQVGEYKVEDAAGRLCGGGIRGVGEDGARVVTRGYLIQMVTQIIWNGSAQHAAVNFPQAEPMAFAPHYPLALMEPLPSGRRCSERDYLAMLPTHESAHIQLFITKLLGLVHHTRLGHYPKGPAGTSYFGPGGGVDVLEAAFVQQLHDVESTIQERNRSRPAYPYLLPSLIPQSINI